MYTYINYMKKIIMFTTVYVNNLCTYGINSVKIIHFNVYIEWVFDYNTLYNSNVRTHNLDLTSMLYTFL